MYFNMFGGSALLHLLAGYPRVVAMFGIAGTVSMLVSPLGPGKHGGSAAYVKTIDRAVSEFDLHEEALAQATREAGLLAQSESADRRAALEFALKACGAHCAELSPESLESDPQLLRDALLLYIVDQYGHELARTPRHAAAR